MSRPRLLDLFCCEGGAGEGYHQAGFEVTGVDMDTRRLRRYPFASFCDDAIAFVARHGHRFDAIHASPPCQRYTTGAAQHGTRDSHPDLVGPIREALRATGKPYVIENVPGAPLEDPTLLCGTMFDMQIEWQGEKRELQRHRHFETNWALPTPGACDHRHPAVSVFGNPGGSSKRDGISFPNTAAWRELMDMPWATGKGMAEAIPPAYTQHIGLSLRAVLDTID